MKKINIALFGLGVVGGGTYDILTKNKDVITKRTGIDYEITHILEKSQDAIKAHGADPAIATTDIDAVLTADDVDIISFCLNGIEPCSTWMLKAMENGKSVVTRNKAAVAANFHKFVETAKANNVCFRFEACVGGGIPELTAITEALSANNFTDVSGILNGTTNYILTKMSQEGMSYADALKDAQIKGFAEADPTADVDGIDCANKLTILMALCFDKYVHPSEIPTTGIRNVTMDEIEAAEKDGCVIKLISKASMSPDGTLTCSIEPTALPKSHPLASVSNEFNAIYVTGDAVGEVMFYGKGAGALPTGSAIVGDMISMMKELQHK